MASAINEIITAIAGWDVRYDSDVFVKTISGENLKTYTGTAEAPVRIISMISPDASESVGFIALGSKAPMRADWQISDLLMLRPIAHEGGDNIGRSEPHIRNYIKNYITEIKNDRSPTNESWIEEVTHTPGTYSYGASGEYYGVSVILSVSEKI